MRNSQCNGLFHQFELDRMYLDLDNSMYRRQCIEHSLRAANSAVRTMADHVGLYEQYPWNSGIMPGINVSNEDANNAIQNLRPRDLILDSINRSVQQLAVLASTPFHRTTPPSPPLPLPRPAGVHHVICDRRLLSYLFLALTGS